MAKPHQAWTVLPHGPIEKLAENLWRVEGAVPGMALKRVMTIARMSDGRLVVHNGIALDDASMRQIDDWGKIAFVLVPNGFHRLDAASFARRYPNAKVLCPRGAKERVAQVVKACGTYDELPADPAVRLEYIEGTRDAEGAMLVRSADGVTVVLNDVVFNMPHRPGLSGALVRLMGSSGGPKITRIARLFLVKDKPALRASLERLAKTEGLVRVIVSHHETITKSPRETLARVAATL